MSKPKILFQFDPDPNASTFDSVVGIDSGIDHLITQCNVTSDNVEGLVHGAMFTRGPNDLKNTAIFFGGSNVGVTETIVEKSISCFFGPMRVSVMADPNGSNTTAAAAVLCAQQHTDFSNETITILAGTGPVGQRIATIVGSQSNETTIRICSRKITKAQKVVDELTNDHEGVKLEAWETSSEESALDAVKNAHVVFAAGAAGIELLSQAWSRLESAPTVAIDLNAVPPAGIAGIEVMDQAKKRGDTFCYGAIGVGELKMKIHKRCLKKLFESNDQVLRVHEIYEIGKQIDFA